MKIYPKSLQILFPCLGFTTEFNRLSYFYSAVFYLSAKSTHWQCRKILLKVVFLKSSALIHWAEFMLFFFSLWILYLPEGLLKRNKSLCEDLTCSRCSFFSFKKPISNSIFFLLEQQMASTAKKLPSPHPVQITKLIRHAELETDNLFEKPFDST